MSKSRFIAYAALGIIGGLMFENGGLRLRQFLGKQTRHLGKEARNKTAQAKKAIHKAVSA